MDTHRGKTMRRHREKTFIYELTKEASEETNLAITLLSLPASKTVRK
jgi:hypothetical protein